MTSAVREAANSTIHLIEVPFNSAGLSTGVARMPDALRSAGLHSQLRDGGPFVVERVALAPMVPQRGPSGLLAESALAHMVRDVGSAVLRAWSDTAVPLVVAGDCPALLGGLIGLDRRGGGGMVFVDGHEDAWPAHLGKTGEASDSEVALALGTYEAPAGLADSLPCLTPNRLLVLGPRDAAEIESEGADSIQDRVAFRDGPWLASADVAATLPTLIQESAGTAPAGWWFHVDLDVLSTDDLPAVDYPQAGGISWAQLEAITTTVLTQPGCRGASIVIYNPDLDEGAAAPRINQYLAHAAALLRGAR